MRLNAGTRIDTGDIRILMGDEWMDFVQRLGMERNGPKRKKVCKCGNLSEIRWDDGWADVLGLSTVDM
jgi:hypothetical protein